MATTLRFNYDETIDYIITKQEKAEKMCSNTQNYCSRAHKIQQNVFFYTKECAFCNLF